MLYLRVTSRLRNLWRAARRRASLDRAYVEMQTRAVPAWANPGAELEARELRKRIEAVVAHMPDAMREVFILVREEELSYKETAERLGVSVGTVHTQLSRANALLRECVARYHADTRSSGQSPRGRLP